MTASWLLLIGTVLVFAAAIPANGVVAEFRRVPWRESVLGRVLFTKALSLAAILDLSLIGSTLLLLDHGRPAWFEAVRLIVFMAVAGSLWVQWHVYRRILAEHTEAAPAFERANGDARDAERASE